MSQLQESRDSSLGPIQLPHHEPANSCQQRFEQALDDLIVAADQLLTCPSYQGHPRDAERLRRLRDLRGTLARFAAQPRESAHFRIDLEQRVRSTARGKRPGGPVAAGPDQLTARQWEIAQLIASGMTNKQIAEQLTLTPGTIANHVEHILIRLNFNRRAQVAAWVAQSWRSGVRDRESEVGESSDQKRVRLRSTDS